MTYLVLCGNQREFDVFADCKVLDYTRESFAAGDQTPMAERFNYYTKTPERLTIGDDVWLYISRPEQMRGHHGCRVRYYGTWHNLENISEILALTASAELP